MVAHVGRIERVCGWYQHAMVTHAIAAQCTAQPATGAGREEKHLRIERAWWLHLRGARALVVDVACAQCAAEPATDACREQTCLSQIERVCHGCIRNELLYLLMSQVHSALRSLQLVQAGNATGDAKGALAASYAAREVRNSSCPLRLTSYSYCDSLTTLIVIQSSSSMCFTAHACGEGLITLFVRHFSCSLRFAPHAFRGLLLTPIVISPFSPHTRHGLVLTLGFNSLLTLDAISSSRSL